MKTLKQFQYFIAIVEHGSFTAASEHLFIAQSALSRQIKILEDQLGFTLFDCTEKKIQLTPAGQVLYQKIKKDLLNLDQSVEMAQRIAQGQGRCLHIAHSSSIVMDAKKLQFLNDLCQQHQIEIELNTLSSEQQIDAVLNGSVDIGFIRPPVLQTLQDVHCTELYAQPLYVAVHIDDAFFNQKDRVEITTLREQKFVSTPHAERGGLSYLVSNLCLSHGFYPQKSALRSRKISQLALVAAQLGICIVPEEFQSILPPNVRLVAIQPQPEPSRVCLIWNKQNDLVIEQSVMTLIQKFKNFMSPISHK